MTIVTILLEIILELVRADERDDSEAVEETLMRAQEQIKRELDRRKFGKK